MILAILGRKNFNNFVSGGISTTKRSYGYQDVDFEVLHNHVNWGRTDEEESSLDGSTN